jgi:hypothetical protein
MPFSIISPNSKYKPHHLNVKVTNEDGAVCGVVAWWADNPIQAAIYEARKVVCMYESYKVNTVRIVTVDNNPIFKAELHPLRKQKCTNV